MANDEHVALLKQGVDAWNAWRKENPDIRPDLSGVDLREANLAGANLIEADLSQTDLTGANLTVAYLNQARLSNAQLRGANLTHAHLADATLFHANLEDAVLREAIVIEANLNGANLRHADIGRAVLPGAKLIGADLRDAILVKAQLRGARLLGTNLSGAHLSAADLITATLIETDLTGADLTGCRVYGISAWRLTLDENTKQQDLIITGEHEPEITVDNIEVAQFIYLMLHNQKIRDVIDTITSKAVLILGRFTYERKAALDAIREELRKRNYVPILFDFDKPTSQTTDENHAACSHVPVRYCRHF